MFSSEEKLKYQILTSLTSGNSIQKKDSSTKNPKGNFEVMFPSEGNIDISNPYFTNFRKFY
jgi:hypothetical protein